MHAHAAEWGGDPDHLTISGHSAGGHLVASAMTTDWPRFAPGRPADMVKAGLSLPQAGLNRELCRALKPKRYRLEDYGH